MILPTIELVDEQGNLLPSNLDESDVQHINQFGNQIGAHWFVRLNGLWDGGVALLSNDKPPLPLVPASFKSDSKQKHWRIPSEKEVPSSLKKQYKQTVGGSGRLQIGLIDARKHRVPFAPIKYLDYLPNNISLAQLQQMIDDIGLLVLSATSLVSRKNITSPIGEGQGVASPGYAWGPGEGALATTASILRLVQVLKQELPRLKARPLRAIKVDIGPVRVDKTLNRPSTILNLYVAPSERRTVVTQTRVESLDCTENQFVRFVLRLLELQIPCIIAQLKIDPPSVSSQRFITHTNQFSLFFNKVENEQASRRAIDVKQAAERKKAAADLFNALAWLAQERKSSFWNNVSEPTVLPSYTLRLIGSPSYAAIYSRFQQLWGHTQSSINHVYFLLQNIQQGHIRPVWEIYEFWCFISLYYAFVLEVSGLQSIGEDLLQAITLDKGELQLRRNNRFTLKGKLPSGDPLEIALWYEPHLVNRDGQDRKPDFLIQLKLGDSDSMYFIFDCKYRNYHEQGTKWLIDDVIGVARYKYLESGLRFREGKEELDVKASFILHTSRGVDYWGEVPFKQYISERFGTKAELQTYDIEETKHVIHKEERLDDEFVEHRYGAIYFCVDQSQNPLHQFRRLLYLMLYYFAEEYDFCPHCGVEAELLEDYDKVQGQGRYYLCPSCKRFWVEHFCCGDGHHRIVKLGKDGFHRPADDSGKWHYACPECGAVLPRRERTSSPRM
jgi:predicted RNA-binding Zn-ribbon protein involved in translation (DUF1610 family)